MKSLNLVHLSLPSISYSFAIKLSIENRKKRSSSRLTIILQKIFVFLLLSFQLFDPLSFGYNSIFFLYSKGSYTP